MGNEEVLHSVKKNRNILYTMKRRKAKSIGHILRMNCFLNHGFEGKVERRIEVMERRGGRRKQLLEYVKKAIGYRKSKVEALDRTLWRTHFVTCCPKTD